MTRGMIVAPQPEAVEAGAMVLKEGGNAIDAGIACAFVQGVVDPQMTGSPGSGVCRRTCRASGCMSASTFMASRHGPRGPTCGRT